MSNINNYITNYQTAKSNSLGQGNLLQQLCFVFEEVVRILYQAKKCQDKLDIEGRYKYLTKVIDIMNCLRSGIDITSPEEVITKLDRFCTSTAIELTKINVPGSSTEAIQVVIDTILSVKESLALVIERELSKVNDGMIQKSNTEELV